MPSTLPEEPLGDSHEVLPNDTKATMANGEAPESSKKDNSVRKDKEEKKQTPRVRASKLEYKTVNQMYHSPALPSHR